MNFTYKFKRITWRNTILTISSRLGETGTVQSVIDPLPTALLYQLLCPALRTNGNRSVAFSVYCLLVTCFLWSPTEAQISRCTIALRVRNRTWGWGEGGGVGDGGRGGGISCAQTEAMIWGKGMNIGSDLNHSWVFLIGVWHPISDQKMSFSTLFFRPTLLAEVSLLHGFYRLRSRSRRLSVSELVCPRRGAQSKTTTRPTENDFVNGNSHTREKPQSYPLKSTSVFRPGVGVERQQKDFLKPISNSHHCSFFLIRLKLKGQMLSHTLVVPSKQLGVPNDCFL